MSSDRVEERLARLEQELSQARRCNSRMLAVAGLVVVGLGLAWALTSVAVPRTIRANEFILLDKNGITRATLGVGEDEPRLYLHDENEKRRAGLAVSKHGPGLVLFDENGEARVTLAVVKAGPGVVLYDENGKPVWRAP